METTKNAKGGERVVLGSGKLYTVPFTGEILADTVIETEENRLGDIQGGAALEYKPTYYTVEDDLGLVKEDFITAEEATFKSGILTWNGKTLGKLCATAVVTDDADKKKRTVKIGGLNKDDKEKRLFRFVHKDNVKGDIRVTIVGKNQAGFTLDFLKDKETVINAEIKGTPLDNEGTLILYEEDLPDVTEVAALNETKEEQEG